MRQINICFEDDDVSLLDRWKAKWGLDYAKTVRKAIGMLRRVERHAGDGFDRMVLVNKDDKTREVDYVQEFIPNGKD